jgi:hypothetical protein
MSIAATVPWPSKLRRCGIFIRPWNPHCDHKPRTAPIEVYGYTRTPLPPLRAVTPVTSR